MDERKAVKRFFSYSPEAGMVLHATAEAAKSDAGGDIDQYRDDARFDGEWPGDVEMVSWGELKEAAAEIENEEGSDYALAALAAPQAEHEGDFLDMEVPARLRELSCKNLHQWAQAEPVAWPMRGVRVDGVEVIISVNGGNDAARWLCGELIAKLEAQRGASTKGATP